jgi:SAM-dependent methyltransferase
MPDEGTWRSFFDPEAILRALKLDERVRDAADFGCGYGTFALPAAQRIRGALYGFDIEAAMIEECRRRARKAGIGNLQLYLRDFMKDGTGLAADSVDCAMLFNILHAEQPLTLLREAWRILRPDGRVAVIHWNHDPATPRGPSMEIRPRPADCRRWIEQAGFAVEGGIIDLPPYHYGLMGQKQGTQSEQRNTPYSVDAKPRES